MNTLQMLRNGQLASAMRLSLSCELKTFPVEIFDLADSLEILDLSNNKLSALPDDFGRLKKLRILFLSENEFKEIPKVLAQCPELTMIGFKSNQISLFPENALPLKVQWLILTDNKLEKLPDSIGKLTKLQKCMLAGNRIHSLPDSMSACDNLELLRISANQIKRLPSWLFELPRLSWLACAGNPFVNKHLLEEEELKEIHWNDITLHEELGRGASGVISRASLFNKEESFAIKIFKGEVTSDGYPIDEIQACITAGIHNNLTTLHGKFHEHPEDKEGLILSLIPATYNNLGNPPNFDTCTRDTYDENSYFVLLHIIRIVKEIASASAHLHSRKIMHGDLYSHNILIDGNGHSLLGDFGAATLYENIDDTECGSFERLEVRAFACLLEDMLDRCRPEDLSSHKEIVEVLTNLKHLCMDEKVTSRPLFRDIFNMLLKI